MPGIGPVTSRTSSILATDNLLRSLQQTQLDLLTAQNQIASGRIAAAPSDAPGKVSSILFLQQKLQARDQWMLNLEQNLSSLNSVDAALGSATDILLEAESIALSQIGVGSDQQTRQVQADIVQAQIAALISIGNQQFNDLSLFGGNNGPGAGGRVFDEFLGGIRYTGTGQDLLSDVGTLLPQPINSNGLDAFGAMSSRVRSAVDLDRQVSPRTRLVHVNGARGSGVVKGSVTLTVDATQATVDLSTIDTLGDVVTRINDAITSLNPEAGALVLTGEGFALSAAEGTTITISDIGAGQTAADLGMDLSVTASSVAGLEVNPGLTQTTLLADLGVAVDFSSGIQIVQGEQTKVADFSNAITIQDLINAVDSLQLGVRLQINEPGTGLDLISEVSGLALSVGENGGTTAQDLGLLTLGFDTELSSFRFGLGVEPVEGADDVQFTMTNGITFGVDVSGLVTVGDLVAAMYSAAGAVDLTAGVDFVIGVASIGNGLVFTDNTTGAGTFIIEDATLSQVATQLGIAGNAGTSNTITSANTSQVKVDGVFSHLMDLRNSLAANDELGITIAGGKVDRSVDRVVQARASVGIEAAQIQQQRERSADLEISEKTMLSKLQDTDLTEVITRFSQLQTQLAASLQVGSQNLRLSLLDFLR